MQSLSWRPTVFQYVLFNKVIRKTVIVNILCLITSRAPRGNHNALHCINRYIYWQKLWIQVHISCSLSFNTDDQNSLFVHVNTNALKHNIISGWWPMEDKVLRFTAHPVVSKLIQAKRKAIKFLHTWHWCLVFTEQTSDTAGRTCIYVMTLTWQSSNRWRYFRPLPRRLRLPCCDEMVQYGVLFYHILLYIV